MGITVLKNITHEQIVFMFYSYAVAIKDAINL